MNAASVPALRRSIDVRRTADGTILVLRGPEDDDLELEADDDRLWRLLRTVDGSVSAGELADEFGPDALDALAMLEDAGLVDDLRATAELGAESAERFSRQLAYFADALGSWPSAVAAQRRLQDGHVVVLGAGGLGTWCALALAAAGVGTLTIVDGDAVELSNLNRQILFDRAQIGARKAVLSEARLRSFHPALDITGVDLVVSDPDDVARVVDGADLAICTLDQPAHDIDVWVHVGCRRAGVPYLAMSQHPPHGRVGPLFEPGRPGCHECQEHTWREEWPRFEAVHRAEQLAPPSATYGPACAVISAMAAHEALAYLAGLSRPRSLGAELIVDLRTWAVSREPVIPRPECESCRLGI